MSHISSVLSVVLVGGMFATYAFFLTEKGIVTKMNSLFGLCMGEKKNYFTETKSKTRDICIDEKKNYAIFSSCTVID